MGVCVEYLEDGILFTGQYLDWNADDQAIREAARLIAPQVRCQPETVERLVRFELTHRRAG